MAGERNQSRPKWRLWPLPDSVISAIRPLVILVVFAGPLYVWGGALSEMSLSAIFQTVAGAVATLVGSIYVTDAAEREKERNRRRDVANNLITKVRIAVDYIYKVNELVKESRAAADEDKIALFQTMKPFIGAAHYQINIESFEVTLFSDVGKAEYATKVGELFSVHNLLVSLIYLYNERKDRHTMWTVDNALVQVQGGVATIAAPPGMQLLNYELGELANGIEKYSRNSMLEPLETAKSLPSTLTQILKDRRFNITIEIVPRPSKADPSQSTSTGPQSEPSVG